MLSDGEPEPDTASALTSGKTSASPSFVDTIREPLSGFQPRPYTQSDGSGESDALYLATTLFLSADTPTTPWLFVPIHILPAVSNTILFT